MNPLWLSHFTATSSIGRGLDQTLDALRLGRSGLAPCAFDTVELATFIGEVAGVDAVQLPAPLVDFDCRNNRLALLGLMQDGAAEAAIAAMKEGKSEVICEQGQLHKVSKNKGGIVNKKCLTKQWTDWVDYWAVDFDYMNRKEIIKVSVERGVVAVHRAKT